MGMGGTTGVSKLVSSTTKIPNNRSTFLNFSMASDVDLCPVILNGIITFVCTEIVVALVLRRGRCSTIDQIPTFESVTTNAFATADMYISRVRRVNSVKFIRSANSNANGTSRGGVLFTEFGWILSVRVHSPPGVPSHPILQVQSHGAVLPTGDSEFTGQCAILPLEQYMFTGHSIQTSWTFAYTVDIKQESTMTRVLRIV
jgi:hypothetical protein